MASTDGSVPLIGWNNEAEKARVLQLARQYIINATPEQRAAYKEQLMKIYTANIMAELASGLPSESAPEFTGGRSRRRRGTRRKGSRRR